jgi:hypothetical protein
MRGLGVNAASRSSSSRGSNSRCVVPSLHRCRNSSRDLPGLRQPHALGGDRRPTRIAAQPLKPRATAPGDRHAGVQVETLGVRMARLTA